MTMILEPFGWAVFHEWNGETNKFFSFDKTSAENYAIKKHGYLEQVFVGRPAPEPAMKENTE